MSKSSLTFCRVLRPVIVSRINCHTAVAFQHSRFFQSIRLLTIHFRALNIPVQIFIVTVFKTPHRSWWCGRFSGSVRLLSHHMNCNILQPEGVSAYLRLIASISYNVQSDHSNFHSQLFWCKNLNFTVTLRYCSKATKCRNLKGLTAKCSKCPILLTSHVQKSLIPGLGCN